MGGCQICFINCLEQLRNYSSMTIEAEKLHQIFFKVVFIKHNELNQYILNTFLDGPSPHTYCG
jgi:hypothetical protein